MKKGDWRLEIRDLRFEIGGRLGGDWGRGDFRFGRRV